MKEIVLSQPILIDGKEVKTLTYDSSKITVEQYVEAEGLKMQSLAKSNWTSTSLIEFDTSFQMYLGMMAIIAVNPTYDVNDLKRIKGKDINKLMVIGRDFIRGEVDNELEENNSVELSEDTVEPSTPQSEK